MAPLWVTAVLFRVPNPQLGFGARLALKGAASVLNPKAGGTSDPFRVMVCCGSASMYRRSVLLLRYQAVRSPPVSVFSTIVARSVCLASRVRVLVRLSHPRPPDRNQHGCTVGVLPGPTRVLPMPRQCGIGRRAPTRAVLSCAASWCLVVPRPRRRVDCLVLAFCFVSSRTPPRHGHGCGIVDLERHFAPLVAHLTR